MVRQSDIFVEKNDLSQAVLSLRLSKKTLTNQNS
jgi:hypothetical protein